MRWGGGKEHYMRFEIRYVQTAGAKVDLCSTSSRFGSRKHTVSFRTFTSGLWTIRSSLQGSYEVCWGISGPR